jgi:hypothetical protein
MKKDLKSLLFKEKEKLKEKTLDIIKEDEKDI